MPIATFEMAAGAGPVIGAWVGPSRALLESDPSAMERHTTVFLNALVDTGAERSVISADVLRRLGLTPIGQIDLLSVTTGPIAIPHDLVSVKVGLDRFPGEEFGDFVVVVGGESFGEIDMLLGRDVLARAILFYHGPQRSLTLGL